MLSAYLLVNSQRLAEVDFFVDDMKPDSRFFRGLAAVGGSIE